MWLYNDKEVSSLEDFPADTYGFIYQVTHVPSGFSYIGKKVLHHNVKKKLTKKQLAEQSGRGRKSTTEVIQKESDWKTYYGSAKPILELLEQGRQNEFERIILKLVPSKKLLTYYECKYLFTMGVLEEPEKWYNDNVLGKFFRKDFVE